MRAVMPRLAVVLSLSLVVAFGCQSPKPAPGARGSAQKAKTAFEPTHLDYVDSDAFDLLFEATLLNGQPVVVVQTEHGKPEWGSRLNAWVAAWNASRGREGFRARGQFPGTVVVDGESIREFRLLIDGLVSHSEESARTGTRWWAEKNLRERRIALLRPYSLRFHLDETERIQLIFFHGDYAADHRAAVRSLANPAEDDALEWSPNYCCSRSRLLDRK